MQDDAQLRSSSACTRAGASALLLSAVALLALPDLNRNARFRDLLWYAQERAILAAAIEDLEHNSCWRMMREEFHIPVDDRLLSTLQGQGCVAPVTGSVEKADQPPDPGTHSPTPESAGPQPPAPPIPMQTHSLSPIDEIVKVLTRLGDSNRVASAKGFSNYYNHEVDSWLARVWRVDYRRLVSAGVWVLRGDEPYWSGGAVPWALYDSGVLHLTVGDVKEISRFKMPDLRFIEDEGGRLVVDVPGVGPRARVVSAVLMLQVATLVCCLWFSAFLQEARLQSAFPASGTLFTVLARSRPQELLLVLLLAVPAGTSTLIALRMQSDRLASAALALATIATCAIISARMPHHVQPKS